MYQDLLNTSFMFSLHSSPSTAHYSQIACSWVNIHFREACQRTKGTELRLGWGEQGFNRMGSARMRPQGEGRGAGWSRRWNNKPPVSFSGMTLSWTLQHWLYFYIHVSWEHGNKAIIICRPVSHFHCPPLFFQCQQQLWKLKAAPCRKDIGVMQTMQLLKAKAATAPRKASLTNLRGWGPKSNDMRCLFSLPKAIANRLPQEFLFWEAHEYPVKGHQV